MSKKQRQAQPQLRIVGVAAPAPTASGPAPTPKAQMSFDQWWSKVSTTKKLKASLKQPLRIHLQARGFMKSGNFDAGLKDFGL